MKSKISLRETMLLIILAVILLFYFLSKGPISRAEENLVAERNSLQDQVLAMQPYINQMEIWDKELDAIFEEYGNSAKSIPEYNNINNIMGEMSAIFDGDDTYSISFIEPTLEDHIVSREMAISFSGTSYDDVVNRLKRINESENRYRITNMGITSGGENLYNVTLNIIAYEYTPEDAI